MEWLSTSSSKKWSECSSTMLHLGTCNFLPHGDEIFVAWDWLVPVEPCTPRFGPLFNAASQTVFDVSLFCRTCVVFLQEHKLTLLRCPGECQTQGFPSLHGVKGRHSILHLVGNMISHDFTNIHRKPWFLLISCFNEARIPTAPKPNPGILPCKYSTTWANHLELVSAQWAYTQRNSMLLIRSGLFSHTSWDKRLCTKHR